MPESFHIDEQQRIVWARSWGLLCDEDIISHQARLRADPKFQATFAELVDTTGVTEVTLTAKMMLQMGQSTLFAPEAKRAYVVAKDVIFGLVRMYELYQSMRGKTAVRVFRSRAEAVAWLGVTDPEATPQPAATSGNL